VARWLGHSPKVAVANYLRVTQEHLIDETCSGAIKHQADGEGFDSIDATGMHTNALRQSRVSFGTETGTLQDENGTFSPDLQAVIQHWPALSEESKTEILAIIRTAHGAFTE